MSRLEVYISSAFGFVHFPSLVRPVFCFSFFFMLHSIGIWFIMSRLQSLWCLAQRHTFLRIWESWGYVYVWWLVMTRSHVTFVRVTCHVTCQGICRVMCHVNESSHTWMRHITFKREWVMSHMNETQVFRVAPRKQAEPCLALWRFASVWRVSSDQNLPILNYNHSDSLLLPCPIWGYIYLYMYV